jgi:hypothetical protein
MSPLFGSVAGVRKIIGSYIQDISDDIINQILLEYSINAQDLGSCSIDEKWFRYAEIWVTYRAALVILYNTEAYKEAGTGKIFKQLGDFSISTGGNPTDKGGLNKLVDWLECQAFKYEIAIRYCTDPALNCEGLTDTSKIPYISKLPGLVERGKYNINKPVPGREWYTTWGEPKGTNTLYAFGKKYKTNLERLGSGFASIYYRR